MTTKDIVDLISSARTRLEAGSVVPSDWLEEVFAGITVRQQDIPRGTWLVEWPFDHQRMVLRADTDTEEVERIIVRPIERTARNWEGE